MPYVNNFKMDGKTILLEDSEAREAITALTRKKAYEGKKIAFIGDSFGAGNGVQKAEAYPQRISTDFKMIGYNYCVGGAGFLRKAGGTGDDFNAELDRIIAADINPDYICIMGGFNDVNWNYTINDIYQAANALVSKINSNLPDTVIIWCGMNFRCYNFTGNFRAYYTQAKRTPYFTNGCIVVDNWIFSLLGNAGYFNADLTHPNSNGHRLIAAAIESAMVGSSMSYGVSVTSHPEGFSPFSECTTNSNSEFSVRSENGKVIMKLSGLTVSTAFSGRFIKSTYTLPQAYRPESWVVAYPYMSNVAGNLRYAISTDGSIYLQQTTATTVNITAGTTIQPCVIEWDQVAPN